MEPKLSVESFQRLVDDYVVERDWKRYHKPKDIAISIAIETSELLELFQWKSDPINNGEIDKELKIRIGEELADVMIYCACMANSTGIDLSDALLNKIQKNRSKYPVEKVMGASDWSVVSRACSKSSRSDRGD